MDPNNNGIVSPSLYKQLLKRQEDFESELREIEEHYREISDKKRKYASDIIKLPELIKQNEQAVKSVEEKIASLKDSALAAKEAIEKAESELNELVEKRKKAEEQLKEAEDKGDQEGIDKFKKEISEFQTAIDKEEKNIRDDKNKVEQYSQQIDESYKLLEDLTVQGKALQGDLKNAENEIQDIEKEIEEVEKHLTDVKDEYKKWSEENVPLMRVYQAGLEVREKNYRRVNKKDALNSVVSPIDDENKIAQSNIIKEELEVLYGLGNDGLTSKERETKEAALKAGRELEGNITAEEARNLAQANIWSMKPVAAKIKEAAESGKTSIMVKDLETTTAIALMDNGYRLYLQHRTPITSSAIKGGRYATDVTISWAYLESARA